MFCFSEMKPYFEYEYTELEWTTRNHSSSTTSTSRMANPQSQRARLAASNHQRSRVPNCKGICQDTAASTEETRQDRAQQEDASLVLWDPWRLHDRLFGSLHQRSRFDLGSDTIRHHERYCYTLHGSCTQASSITTYAELGINILSTLLLATSCIALSY